jgi:RNA polymerase sigma-70 factor (ECF subfamily)
VDGRAEAIENLYRERYVNFRNAVATVTGSYDSAKDAVQEGFVRALRQRSQFRGEGSLEAWVWRIVLRAALEIRAARSGEPVEGILGAELVEPERDPDLARALRALPPRRRLVVFLHYYADLPYAAIAELCAISEGTVAATLAQARAALLDALERQKTYD